MTDKELLEAASRAAGLPAFWDNLSSAMRVVEDGGRWYLWRPLTDDGDALRLAMHLGMRVSLREAHADGGAIRKTGEDEDAMAATRRAIVRAAAMAGDA